MLKAEAFRFQEEGLIPLKECHDLIAGKLKSTKLYVEEGHNILRAGGLSSSEETLMFSEKASLLGRLVKVQCRALFGLATFPYFWKVSFCYASLA